VRKLLGVFALPFRELSMLNLYRRHTKKCTKGRRQHDRKSRDCKCIVYVEGKLDKASEYVKATTGTRSWEEARRMLVAAELRGAWGAPAASPALSISQTDPKGGVSAVAPNTRGSVTDAVEQFLAELRSVKGRNLAESTCGKYKTLLKRLVAFCTQCGLVAIREVTLESLRLFRDSWPTGPRASANNVQRLRTFYGFCVANRWAEQNTALDLKYPKKIKPTQNLPFSDQEVDRIVQAAATMPLGAQQTATNFEIECFILLLRYTGLRISDASLFTEDRLVGNTLGVYQLKSGEWVRVPVPAWLVQMLGRVEVRRGGHLFCWGSSRLGTITDLWRRRIKLALAHARVRGTPHRFRHTFAIDLLSNGVDLKNVSMLLGHSSITTTEKHYGAWVKSRQDALTHDIERLYSIKGKLFAVGTPIERST
jgi:site-specific recombinase XerD